MKKFLLAAFLLFSALPSFAQFHIGISSGGSFSFWRWYIKNLDTDLDFKPALGWRVAVMGEWQIKPMIGLRFESGVQVKSNKVDDLVFDDGTTGGVFREHYQYLDGSLLLQVCPFSGDKRLYFAAGLTAGRLMSGWSRSSGFDFEEANGRREIDIKNAPYNRNSIAADLGVGGNIPLDSRSTLKVETRIQYQLNNFSNVENVDARVHPVLFSVAYLHRI